jgi:hypothetical protein
VPIGLDARVRRPQDVFGGHAGVDSQVEYANDVPACATRFSANAVVEKDTHSCV